jgi:cytidyltransferase-like protein
VVVSGSFDDLKFRHMRFLEEAARLGPVHVLLWTDAAVQALEGHPPKFPQAERQYFVEAIRYVDALTLVDALPDRDALPAEQATGFAAWVVESSEDGSAKRGFCDAHGLQYRVIEEDELQGFPSRWPAATSTPPSGRKKVIVTGCYDWFHSGHVRFFEEVSELGELYVVVGHDANIKLLKGEGHPMYSEDQRRYMAGSIRHVHQALVSTGDGWLDAEPEIERIKPDIYAVNEDGDRPEKREYCEGHGIEYRVLKRLPKEGLPKRQSTDLRGF